MTDTDLRWCLNKIKELEDEIERLRAPQRDERPKSELEVRHQRHMEEIARQPVEPEKYIAGAQPDE